MVSRKHIPLLAVIPMMVTSQWGRYDLITLKHVKMPAFGPPKNGIYSHIFACNQQTWCGYVNYLWALLVGLYPITAGYMVETIYSWMGLHTNLQLRGPTDSGSDRDDIGMGLPRRKAPSDVCWFVDQKLTINNKSYFILFRVTSCCSHEKHCGT